MPKLTMAAAMSCRGLSTSSITRAEPAMPTRMAPKSSRATVPFFTGSRPVESRAISSSVRIAAPFLIGHIFTHHPFAQGLDGAVHCHLDRRFRQAGALGGIGDGNTVQLDVLHQPALGRRQLGQKLAHVAPGNGVFGLVMAE